MNAAASFFPQIPFGTTAAPATAAAAAAAAACKKKVSQLHSKGGFISLLFATGGIFSSLFIQRVPSFLRGNIF